MNKFLTACLLTVLLAMPCFSKTEDQQGALYKLQKTLQTRFPNLKVESVQPGPWPGMYEVVTDNELVYASADGGLMFVGNIMDTKSRENLTVKRWNELLQVDFNELPLDMAIKVVYGDGKRRLAVFADAYCPFCARLEQTMQGMTDMTVYTFLLPVESLHPGVTKKTQELLCAKDRVAAWQDWILRKKETPVEVCKAEELDKLEALGQKLKVTGTPTLIFADGRRIAGALSKDQLEQELNRAN